MAEQNQNKAAKWRKIHLIAVCVLCVLMVALIVGDCFAYRYSSIISGFFGSNEQLVADDEKVEEAAKTGDEVVRKIADEGVVLMKNEENKEGDPTLPLPEETRNINIFGWGATDSGFLLAGNGSGRSYVHPDNKVTLLQAFKDSGFTYNQEIIDIYEAHCKDEDKDWGETADWGNRYNTKLKEPVTATAFPSDVVQRAKEFSDTALIVLSRYSGEYIGRIASTQKKHDLPEDTTRSFNEISTEEETLIQMCTKNFNNVIVVFNTGSIMDMSFLYDEEAVGHIGAAMNVGYMGQSGATAIPKILTGEVNPSGKLADTVVFDPDVNEITRVNGESTDIVYAEDIYMGYKWYETAGEMGYYNNRSAYGRTGYDAVVEFPFGYGLSYTEFEWTLESVTIDGEPVSDGANIGIANKESEFEITVKVKNTGDVAGKDVVELYFSAPYISGGIEKAAVNLLNFEKTVELAPAGEEGDEDTVSFSFTLYDLASYDCYDKNNNGTTGWELDPGAYELKLMTDAHTLKEMGTDAASDAVITFNIPDNADNSNIRYSKDPVSGGRIRNRFTGENAYAGVPLDGSTLGENWTYLSRSNISGTIPTERSTLTSSAGKTIVNNAFSYEYNLYDYASMPTMGVDSGLRLVTYADGSFVSKAEFDDTTKLKGELVYNEDLVFELGDPANWNSDTWTKLLDQLTLEDLCALVEDSGYGTQAIESVGKPHYLEYDGPSGFNRTNMSPNVAGSKMTALPAENLVGQTWNKELAYQAGQIVGIDGQNFGINGIYAPCVNLHREVLNGRNYECYSEDAIISGYMAANFIKGAKSNGVWCYLKHLALYDSGPYCDKRVWITEQNFRENYLRPFEIAIKEGGATAMMASFNRIGPMWSGANEALIDGICRTEFGFRGSVITDYSNGTEQVMNISQGLRAGLNTQLNPQIGKVGSYGEVDVDDPVEVNLARESAKSILFTDCNAYWFAKTNTALNDYNTDVGGPQAISKGFEWWIPVVVAINVVVGGLLIWQIVMFVLSVRKQQPPESDPGGRDE